MTNLHLTKYFAENGTVGVEHKIVPMEWVEGFGARHVLGKRGFRLIAKYAGEVWECHNNKNTQFFKALNKSKARNEIWANKESDRWFDDSVWVAISSL